MTGIQALCPQPRRAKLTLLSCSAQNSVLFGVQSGGRAGWVCALVLCRPVLVFVVVLPAGRGRALFARRFSFFLFLKGNLLLALLGGQCREPAVTRGDRVTRYCQKSKSAASSSGTRKPGGHVRAHRSSRKMLALGAKARARRIQHPWLSARRVHLVGAPG